VKLTTVDSLGRWSLFGGGVTVFKIILFHAKLSLIPVTNHVIQKCFLRFLEKKSSFLTILKIVLLLQTWFNRK
jgi:hypothetical protein